MGNDFAERIKQAALSFGYDKCGIIKIEDMRGYAEKLSERIETFPEVKPFFFKDFLTLHFWMKSILGRSRLLYVYDIMENIIYRNILKG